MNLTPARKAVDALPRWRNAPRAAARVVVLGTGPVGRAFLERFARIAARQEPARRPVLVEVADSRHRWLDGRFAVGADRARLAAADLGGTLRALGEVGTRIVVDATASDGVAALHAAWLARGVHVVTACKLGAGTRLDRAQAIRAAAACSGARYGDSATVGAGLPVLRSVRALRGGGERIHAIAGVLSGSLAWLLSRFDGSVPFVRLVEEARSLGLTEPDPRDDLRGEDVRRKLLILVRAAGVALAEDAVRVESLEALDDAALASRRRAGHVLRYVARWDAQGARAALESLPADDPLAAGGGTDNRVAIWSDRYRERPLVLQGPGAGPEVTAGALLDDVLAIVRG